MSLTRRGDPDAFLPLEQLAERCGLSADLVRRLVRLGLIDAADEEGELFALETTVRVQRIARLHGDLGVNYAGAGVVLQLLEQIEVLEARLRRLQDDE